MEHFAPAVRAGADAVLAASVFHFGELTIGEVKDALRADGHPSADNRRLRVDAAPARTCGVGCQVREVDIHCRTCRSLRRRRGWRCAAPRRPRGRRPARPRRPASGPSRARSSSTGSPVTVTTGDSGPASIGSRPGATSRTPTGERRNISQADERRARSAARAVRSGTSRRGPTAPSPRSASSWWMISSMVLTIASTRARRAGDQRGGPDRTFSTSARPVAVRDPCLRVLGLPGQGREPDAGRQVGAPLADHEVGREVAGAPGVAQGRGVRSELEEGVAQGLAFGRGRRGRAHRWSWAPSSASTAARTVERSAPAAATPTLALVTTSRARLVHAVTAAVAIAALVLQTVLVMTGASVLAETEVPPLLTRLGRLASYFTIQSNVLVAVTAVQLARDPSRDGRWWRAVRVAAVVGITVTGLVHFVLLRPLLDLAGANASPTSCCTWSSPCWPCSGGSSPGPAHGHPGATRSSRWGGRSRGSPGRSSSVRVTGWYPYPFLDVAAEGVGAVVLTCVAVTVCSWPSSQAWSRSTAGWGASRSAGRPPNRPPRPPRQNDRVPTPDPIPVLDPAIAARLKRDPGGLVAAVVQQHDTGEVLMLGWMDDEALRRTLTQGRVTYWSRSRGEYWRKGDTSGHVQHVRSVALDCDGDALLVRVDQVGAACHTGDRTCFDADDLVRSSAARPVTTGQRTARREHGIRVGYYARPRLRPDLAHPRRLRRARPRPPGHPGRPAPHG